MERFELRKILEALLFMASEPLTAAELKNLILERLSASSSISSPTEDPERVLDQLQRRQEALNDQLTSGEIKQALHEISDLLNGAEHGIELVEVAKGYQLRTKLEMQEYVKLLFTLPKTRFTAPSMDTLAIVAYQQPISRAKIEEIRGVDSGGVLKTLLERDLVRIVGRSEDPGKPILYGTTKTFLETFSLNSLADLPSLKDLQELDASLYHAPMESEDTLNDLEGEIEEVEVLPEEAASELLDELENSMLHIRELEKNIFAKPKMEEASTDEPPLPERGRD